MTALDLLIEPAAYAFFSVYLLAVVLLSSWGVASVLGHLRRRTASALTLKKVAVMVILVTLVGAIGDAVWLVLFAGRLYVDPDPIVAFSPFIPFMVDTGSGGRLLGGFTSLQAELLWAASAAVCWLSSWAIYRRVSSRGLALLDRFLGMPSQPAVRSAGGAA